MCPRPLEQGATIAHIVRQVDFAVLGSDYTRTTQGTQSERVALVHHRVSTRRIAMSSPVPESAVSTADAINKTFSQCPLLAIPTHFRLIEREKLQGSSSS